jgi:hypothetical protein
VLGRGELPLWNPHLNLGEPFLANPNNLVLHPSGMLFLLLPVPVALNVAVVGQVLFAALALYARFAGGSAAGEPGGEPGPHPVGAAPVTGLLPERPVLGGAAALAPGRRSAAAARAAPARCCSGWCGRSSPRAASRWSRYHGGAQRRSVGGGPGDRAACLRGAVRPRRRWPGPRAVRAQLRPPRPAGLDGTRRGLDAAEVGAWSPTPASS